MQLFATSVHRFNKEVNSSCLNHRIGAQCQFAQTIVVVVAVGVREVPLSSFRPSKAESQAEEVVPATMGPSFLHLTQTASLKSLSAMNYNSQVGGHAWCAWSYPASRS